MEKTREGTAEPGIVTGWAVSKISKSNLRKIIHSQVEAYRDPSWITSRDNEQQSISFKNALAKIDGCPNQARGPNELDAYGKSGRQSKRGISLGRLGRQHERIFR